MPRRSALGTTQLVVALTLLAGVLRFATLDAKGFWEDEAATAFLVQRGFGHMLSQIASSGGGELTPPFYYSVAWLWAKLFGTGEIGLRSLPALIGTATVPAVYLTARELVSKRAAAVAALLVTVNPLLVWYSQEARSYALLVLLTTVSLRFFVRALRAPAGEGGRAVVWWAVPSALAVMTHYFALFVVFPQLLWLLHRRRDLRNLRAAAVALPVVAAGSVAIALVQRSQGTGGWIEKSGLVGRVAEIPGLFLIGFETPSPVLLAAIAGSCAALALWLLARRGEADDRAGAVLAGSVAVVAVALPLLLSVAGFDYLVYKNVIAALVPGLIVLAAGFAAPRAGAPGAAALALLCVLSLGVLAVTADEPKYRREDWRAVAQALGPARVDRAIVATPREPARQPLEWYLRADPMPTGGAAVQELVLVAGARRELGSTAKPRVPRPESVPRAPHGFRFAGRHDGDKFVLFRYRATRPIRLSLAELDRRRIDIPVQSMVLLDRASTR